MALKRPAAISFSKKNDIHPFDSTSSSTSTSSLEFWANKNDASLFLVGQSNKKRPNSLIFVRMYDGRVLDMLEVGVEGFTGIADLKVRPPHPSDICRSDHCEDSKINARTQAIDAFCL